MRYLPAYIVKEKTYIHQKMYHYVTTPYFRIILRIFTIPRASGGSGYVQLWIADSNERNMKCSHSVDTSSLIFRIIYVKLQCCLIFLYRTWWILYEILYSCHIYVKINLSLRIYQTNTTMKLHCWVDYKKYRITYP